MRRLVAFLFAALVLATDTFGAAAQEAGKVRRVGFLAVGETLDTIRPGVLAELGRQGFVEGRNLAVEERVGPGPRLPELGRELASHGSEVIVAIGVPAVFAAIAAAGESMPIVGWFGSDPVALGVANSHARPGRNVTGFLVLAAELDGKRLDILREAVPGARRFAALALNPTRHAASIKEMRAVAASADLELQVVFAETAADYPSAFAAMRAGGAQGLVIAGAREFHQDGPVLAAYARDAGLPTVCEWSSLARAGCMLGYGASFDEILRRTGQYVAQILRGASAGELPIEHPSRIEFAINLKTARALNLDIPHPLLLRADEVIE